VHTVRDRCYQEQGQLHCTVGEDVQFNQGWVVISRVRSGQRSWNTQTTKTAGTVEGTWANRTKHTDHQTYNNIYYI